jgi:hypothetical protein
VQRRHVIPILLVAGLLVPLAACGDDDDTATSESTTTTTTTTTSTTTTTAVASSAGQVVWPPADGSVIYDDPVAAATGFATDLVGFVDPVVGEFQQGDNRSGEVSVQAAANGPVTTVLVRQLGDDGSWSVLGAATEQIVPTTPAPGASVTSPVQLAGTSTAFEGTVQVAVHPRAAGDPLGTGFVTGGSMGEMGPFEGSLEFTAPGTADGAIVYTALSMENGQVWLAAVVPVAFTTG